MTEFKVGDRIAMYHSGQRWTGTVKGWHLGEPEKINVKIDGENPTFCRIAHPKQLRKLKPKSGRRRIWIRADEIPKYLLGNRIFVSSRKMKGDGWLEFIEVRRKK